MQNEIKYTLEFAGEFHTGSGTGLPGLVDEFVFRDPQGFSVIPASHIKGLLRDSTYRMLQKLNMLNSICTGQQTWHKDQIPDPKDFCSLQASPLCILCALFGSPSISGGVRFSPATYEQRDTLATLELADCDAYLSAHATIDRKTRRAKPKHLFNLEVVRPLGKYKGSIKFIGWYSETTQLTAEKLQALLLAALLFTRRVGGKRRRGWGACKFELPANLDDSWMDLL